MKTSETKEEFIKRYRSKLPFEEHNIAMPCDCEDGGGPTHWAAVSRKPHMVADHLELYAPPGTLWPEEIEKPNED